MTPDPDPRYVPPDDDRPSWEHQRTDRRPSRASEVAEAAWLVLLIVVAVGLVVVSVVRWWPR